MGTENKGHWQFVVRHAAPPTTTIMMMMKTFSKLSARALVAFECGANGDVENINWSKNS